MVAAPRVLTIVAARSGSTRLPNKIYERIGEKTILERVLDLSCQIGPTVVVGYPNGDEKLAYVFMGDRLGVGGFEDTGKEQDVLGRYWRCAQHFNADHVVRVTADCPFLDVEAARFTLWWHLDTGAEFTHYIAEGRGVEVFSRWALEQSNQDAQFKHYREHPDEWILQHQEEFHVETVKFSVDTQQDLDRLRRWHGEESQ